MGLKHFFIFLVWFWAFIFYVVMKSILSVKYTLSKRFLETKQTENKITEITRSGEGQVPAIVADFTTK